MWRTSVFFYFFVHKLQYSLYVSDVANIITFADDTNPFCSGTDFNCMSALIKNLK